MKETDALQKTYQILLQVDENSRIRILGWLNSKFNSKITLDDEKGVAIDSSHSIISPADITMHLATAKNNPKYKINDLLLLTIFMLHNYLAKDDGVMFSDLRKYLANLDLDFGDAIVWRTRELNDLLKQTGVRVSNLTRSLSVLEKKGEISQIWKTSSTTQGQRLFTLTSKGQSRSMVMIRAGR